jgi:hypothetical protein
VTSGLVTALLTGAFGLGGVLGGVLLTSHFAQRADQRRIISEDERRWLADRRQVYARYLAIVTSMLRSIDGTSSFLGSEEKAARPDDESILKEDVFTFYQRWDNELQPVLGEVQLLANPKVAELADRTSWALMELNGFIDSRQLFEIVTEYGFKTRYLLEAVRNAMRAEIGLTSSIQTFPMPKDWPWLPDEHGASDGSTSSGAESPAT